MTKVSFSLLTTCGLALTGVSSVYADPPTEPTKPPMEMVKKATIHLEQGQEIYANGNMQAVVRVNYELESGVTLRTINLKEYGTGLSLHSLGWSVSTTENGFDHNIGQVRHAEAAGSNDAHHGSYRKLYISTKRENESIQACVEVNVAKDGEEDTYSTCYDMSIANGSVSISARRPLILDGSDFEFAHEKTVWKQSGLQVYDIYHLKRGPHIPANMTFKAYDRTVEAGPVVEHFRTPSLIRDYQTRDRYGSYLELIPLTPNVNYTWKTTSASSGRPKSTKFDTKASDSIYAFLNIVYDKRVYRAEDALCKGASSCVQWGVSTFWWKYDPAWIRNRMHERLSASFQMIDNYGSVHGVNFYYLPIPKDNPHHRPFMN